MENQINTSVYKRIFVFLKQNRAVDLLIIISLYILAFSLLFPKTFATYGNFQKVLLSMSIECFIVIAMSLLLISGEIDLSLGSNLVLSGIICASLIKYNSVNILVAIIITLAVSVLMGMLNGIIVARIGVNSLITTLATGLIFLGVAVWMVGPGLTDFPMNFQNLGHSMFLQLRRPVWYMLIIVAIFTYLLSNTRFFRQYYYIGGNIKSAVLSGIDIKKMKIVVFIIASLLASTAGMIAAARFNSAMTSVGSGVELRAVTAAVIGGVSFTGGIGTIPGAALGALFVAFLNNGLIIAGVEPNLSNIFTGVILILSIVIDKIIVREKV